MGCGHGARCALQRTVCNTAWAFSVTIEHHPKHAPCQAGFCFVFHSRSEGSALPPPPPLPLPSLSLAVCTAAPMLDALATGLRECKSKQLVGSCLSMDTFFDSMLRSRISRRVIAEQHLQLSHKRCARLP